MINAIFVNPEKNQCNSCGRPGYCRIGVSTYPQLVTTTTLCVECAQRMKQELTGILEIPLEPKPAPSGSRGIMEITKEQLDALNFATKNLGRAFDIIPDDFNKHQLNAEEAVNRLKQCFGASSRDYITLYPTIG